MTTRAKPLFVALALALGASAPAFAQSSGDTGDNTNAKTTPPASAPSQVTSPADASAATTTTGHMYSTQPAVVAPAPNSAPAMSDDARERAERSATTTSEEEHGGLRNRIKNKKERAREKLGLGPDKD